MRPRTLAVVVGLVSAAALAPVVANFVVGDRLFERTVVKNPYEAGLRHDAERKKAQDVDCALAAGPCEKAVGARRVVLDVGPRPPRAMQDLLFTVRVLGPGAAGLQGGAELALAMPGMYMGELRVKLSPAGPGAWQGQGVFVRCASGSRVWTAAVRLPPEAAGGEATAAAFTFELAE